jgi:uncharacterized membrane protein YhaH (DUF805 family)
MKNLEKYWWAFLIVFALFAIYSVLETQTNLIRGT